MSNKLDQKYIWLVGGHPVVGDLEKYAHDWRMCYYSEEAISDTVLTWEPDSDPVTWDVHVTPLGYNPVGNLKFRITIDNMSVTFVVKART